MKKHVKNYMSHFGYNKEDFIPCEICARKAVDIHHVKFKSQGGSDESDNLIALCRDDHLEGHGKDSQKKREEFLTIINSREN